MEESGSNDKEIRVVCNGVVKKLLVPASALVASNTSADLQPDTEDALGVSEANSFLQDNPSTTIQPQVITPDGFESLPNLSGENFSTPAVVPSTLYQANSAGSTPAQLNFSASFTNPLFTRPPLYGTPTTGALSENFLSTSFPQVRPISITPNVASPPQNPQATAVTPPRESDGVHLTDLSQLNELLAKSAARNASVLAANSQALHGHQNMAFHRPNTSFPQQNTPTPIGAPIANPNFLSIAPKAPPMTRYRSISSPAPSNHFMGHQQPSTSLMRPSNVIVVRGKNPPKRQYPELAPKEPETTLISMRDAEGVVRQLPVQVMTDSQGIKRRVVGYSESGGQRSAVVHTEGGLILCPMNDQTASKEQATNYSMPPQAQPPDHPPSVSKQVEASSVQQLTQDMESSDTESASETLSSELPAVHYSKAEYEHLIKQARKYPTRVVLRNLKMRSRKQRVPMRKLASRFWMHLKCDWLGTPGLLRPFRFTSATGSKVKVSSMQVHTSCDLNEWYRVIPSDQIGLCKDPKTVTSPQTIRSPNHVRVLPLVTESPSPKPVAAPPKQKTPKAKPRNAAIPLKSTAKTKPEVKKKANTSKSALSPGKRSPDYLDKLIDSVARSGGSSWKLTEKKPKTTSEKQVRQILSSYNTKSALELHVKSNLQTARVDVEVLGSTLQRSLVIGQSLADTMQALCLDEDSETEVRTKKMAENCRREAERSLKKSKKKKEKERSAGFSGLLASVETPKTSASKRNKTPKSRARKVKAPKNITPPPTLTRRLSAEIMSPETEFSPPVLHRYCDGADCIKCRGNDVIVDDETAAVMTAMRRRSSSGRVLRGRSRRGSQSNLFEDVFGVSSASGDDVICVDKLFEASNLSQTAAECLQKSLNEETAKSPEKSKVSPVRDVIQVEVELKRSLYEAKEKDKSETPAEVEEDRTTQGRTESNGNPGKNVTTEALQSTPPQTVLKETETVEPTETSIERDPILVQSVASVQNLENTLASLETEESAETGVKNLEKTVANVQNLESSGKNGVNAEKPIGMEDNVHKNPPLPDIVPKLAANIIEDNS